MAKELTHRADELAGLGWSAEDVNRYAELWDYRQRWGAMNLSGKTACFCGRPRQHYQRWSQEKQRPRKAPQEKSYYRWLRFHLDAMTEAEAAMTLNEGDRGVWPILLEEELRLLDYYEPVLGLPDTLKAKAFDSFRTQMTAQAAACLLIRCMQVATTSSQH